MVGIQHKAPPLSHVFFKNLHLKQALNFRISLACFRCSGRRGPFLRPTRFSPSTFPFGVDFFMTLSVDLAAIGLFLEAFRPGEPAELWEPGERTEGAEDLAGGIGMGRTRADGLTPTDGADPQSIEGR